MVNARRIAMVLAGPPRGEQVGTALRLAERLLARGHRVTVFAAREAATLAAGSGEIADGIAALVRRGVHGGTLDWVVDGAAVERAGVGDRLVQGVVEGDAADLWGFVRDADVLLSVGGGV